jgi:hypothetical protein
LTLAVHAAPFKGASAGVTLSGTKPETRRSNARARLRGTTVLDAEQQDYLEMIRRRHP